MLRMSVRNEEYLMIGDNVKIVFLGGGAGQTRIMIDAPKEINIVRSRVLEKRITDPEELAAMLKYYREPEHPEKYKKKLDGKTEGKSKATKSNVVIVRNQLQNRENDQGNK